MRARCLHDVPRVPDSKGAMICPACRSQWRKQNRRKKLGYDDWFEQQRGLCAFCGLAIDANSNRTHLDHSHVTGRKRGLVHAACNIMIGGLENAVALIGWDRIRAYLA